ncbi:MAG: phage portal protein [Alphaproteobacteria bacterium]|nr:phage portal protein [Alphaproteobacteria bacterium]
MTKQKPTIHYAVRGGFDAASRSPEAMRHWRAADGLSADAALSSTVRHIVISRARYECANNGYADGIIQTLAEDAVGTGPRLQLFLSDAPDAQNREKAMRAAMQRREMRFRDWTEQIDLTEKLKLARIAKARDGEVFLRIVRNPVIEGAAKFDITLFEAEQVGSRIVSEYADFYEDGTVKEFDGIEYDRFGNPAAYRFWKVHPGATGIGFITDDSVLIPADKVIHYAHIMRPGQHRGLSEIASTLNIFNDLRRYTNAVLSAAETAAEISFLLHTNAPADADEPENSSPIKFMDVVELVRNAGLALPEGWDASQMKTEHPQDKYVDFVDAKIAEAARPLSMPFAIAKGDCSKSNYASGRLDHQIYHRKIFGERKRIERNILNRILREFESFDMIAFPADYKDENFILHSWMWDGFEHVDPVKEANAQATRLANRTTTLAEECAREGKDYEFVLRQIAREAALAAELGLIAPAAAAPAAGNADENDDQQEEKE